MCTCIIRVLHTGVFSNYPVTRFRDTLQFDGMSCFVVLQDSLLTASVEVHTAASQSFSEVAASGLIAPHVFVTTMLPTILTHYDSKNAGE